MRKLPRRWARWSASPLAEQHQSRRTSNLRRRNLSLPDGPISQRRGAGAEQVPAGGRIVLAMPAHAFDPAFAVAARQVRDRDRPVRDPRRGRHRGARSSGRIPAGRGATRRPPTPTSITKPIVATAVVRLAQDVPAEQAPLPHAGCRVGRGRPPTRSTGWHVLTHTTGIADIDLEQLLLEGGDRPELIRRTIAAARGPGASSATPRSPSTCWPKRWSAPWTGRSMRCSAKRCWTRWG